MNNDVKIETMCQANGLITIAVNDIVVYRSDEELAQEIDRKNALKNLKNLVGQLKDEGISVSSELAELVTIVESE